ncbi:MULTISPECIES: hypothetical protein [unclassified Neptuniibacter]|jgi:hypothetical protein|uniref:hypothetical protein n=1 Tax=unclassified Neptuniibacter TaxID=2630693 RepID=UPI0026E279F0|nr:MULTISPECIES: hypothetical protein [unclassified Neptuniibacter]MDO6514945.1 hypothetical protein [Neptuniibacter sp. 2_MG-2023]MDO6594296.1 hypothetical protein [Neptuniibacter sp. 1_MG-2023]
MSIPTSMSLNELIERTHSLTETHHEILSTCESIEEIISLNNWYWNAMNSLWQQANAPECAA